MWFLEWWTTLSGWIRYPVAISVIAVSTLGFFSPAMGFVARPLFYARLCGLGWALGFILLIYGPSEANKKGYHL
jgi:hypothetical protein